MTGHWAQISELSDADTAIDMASIATLYESWFAAKRELEKTSKKSLAEFNSKLVRRLSIESGILERIYDLDRGTTEALVEAGFSADLVARSSTTIEPSHLIDILRDQEAAVLLVMDCIAQSRPLSKSVIHELHRILMAHQHFTTAKDQFGNRIDISLQKVVYKTQPNNPERPDGSIHGYCPPIHVESEMDTLLALLNRYDDRDPVIVAAWFHHRFAQIHPYQDGNGRLARVLTTMILLKRGLLPLVVDRDLRGEYISALEDADAENLQTLVSLFSRLEKSAILQALSVNVDAEIGQQRLLTKAVLASISARLGRRREQKNGTLRRVNDVALAMRGLTRKSLETHFSDLKQAILQVAEADVNIADGGPDRVNSHWYKFEVMQTAGDAGQYANFSENHYFVKAAIRTPEERLVFVASFHHVGRELTGVMEATAFARIEEVDLSEERGAKTRDFILASIEPFAFTYQSSLADIEPSFLRWLDASVAVAMKEFGDRI